MTRRKAAAAPPTPAVPPLEGCAIALSGKFDSLQHTHSSLEQLIKDLGGTVTKSVTKATTHVVCTEEDYYGSSVKVMSGKAKDLPLVSPEWIFESEKQQKVISAASHVWGQSQPPPQPAPSSQESNASKKRPIMITKSDEDEPENKRTKTADETADAQAKPANGTRASRGKAAAKGKSAKVKNEESDDNAPAKEAPKEDKTVAAGQFLKKKDVLVPVDEYCPLSNYQVYIEPDSGMIYDAALNQTHATNNANKFYRIQVLVEPRSSTYKTWTRWGRVGEIGQNAILGGGTLPDAIKNFEKKFKDKSGLTWANRDENPKPGKYAFVEKSYNPDEDDEEEDTEVVKKEQPDYKPPECKLSPSIRSLMELIFNQQYFQATMSALNYDANKLPLGKLSKGNILRGFQQLKDLAALMDDASLASSRWGMDFPNAIEQLSNLYYSIIPHAFGRNRPPVISDKARLKQEIDLLESLSDMKDADQIMKDLKKVDDVHPLDTQFHRLGMEEMTVLDRGSSEFQFLEQYLQGSKGQTHHVQYRVQDIFRIERQGEKDRFDEYAKASKIGANRRLLWHGSRATNFGGILSQGLRIAPPEAPVSGYMFGKGIYLADMSSKSANYCCSYNSGGQALLLLCEAKLGDPIQQLTGASYNAGTDALANGMESTWGMGRTAPTQWMDAGSVHPSLTGIQMPDMSVAAGPTNIQGAGLIYNEYICYDVAQVKLRYLFRVQM